MYVQKLQLENFNPTIAPMRQRSTEFYEILTLTERVFYISASYMQRTKTE